MDRFYALIFLAASTCMTGCTAIALERHTANQAMTGTDIRYQLVLDNLARKAANGGRLPSFGTMAGGIANVTDSGTFDAKTLLDSVKGFTGETLTGTASRNPDLQWTIDPVHTADQLAAIDAAVSWVLRGTAPADNDPASIRLKNFRVYNDILCLMGQYPGWLCVATQAHAPKDACRSATYCGTSVWVAPQGMAALSEFTLVLVDIATIDPGTLTGVASVTLARQGDANKKAIATKFVPFTVDGSGRNVKLGAVVCYGDPDKCINVCAQAPNPCRTASEREGMAPPAGVPEQPIHAYPSGSYNAPLEHRQLQESRALNLMPH